MCSGRTGHTEAVLVVIDPARTSYAGMLRTFWEGHDATQDMCQGNDVGSQCRSAVYATSEVQLLAANPNGYCGLGGTGVSCPIGLGT